MFNIDFNADGNVEICGRLDAANAENALRFLNGVNGPCVIDMGQLEYISSAGLGVLLRTHKRLMGDGNGIKLVQVSPHINDIFSYSGFDKLFEIEALGASG
jgi:anti-sigma B factor antagonist